MSWQAYIDTSLVGTGNIDKAIICDVNDKTVWAATPGFSIPDKELQVVYNAFKEGSSSPIYGTGIQVNGEKYTVITLSEDTLLTKKGKEGLIFAKTSKAVIIGHHPDTVLTQAANNTVEALADYLKGVGY
ncbi:profilin [Lophiotrema nucula]|uniref:Profilin n=1 Tax=Lophiotrema nucula TaxID=690887 RepID=A0A6A5ZA98_9PLEO|nr:profilin [Lophiotrema nucula]